MLKKFNKFHNFFQKNSEYQSFEERSINNPGTYAIKFLPVIIQTLLYCATL